MKMFYAAALFCGGWGNHFLSLERQEICPAQNKWHNVGVRELQKNSSETIAPAFTERPAWRAVGDGWRHLHGSVRGAGVSFEWHDFKTHGGI